MATDNIFISKASAISFVIQRGAGTISYGETPTDFEFLDGDSNDFFNCEKAEPTGYCQKFVYGDSIMFQFIYETTAGLPPVVSLYTAAGALVTYITPIDASTTYSLTTLNVWQVQVDPEDLPEPDDCDCYYLEIGSYDIDDTNNFVCGDFGRFESAIGTWGASTGGNNVLSQSAVRFHQGVNSALITANALPSVGSATIFQCSSPLTFTANSYYQYSGWVFITKLPEAPGFIGASESIKWDLSGFSDATIISQVNCAGTNNNAWVNISVIFRTGSDVSQAPKIICTGTPQGGGKVFIDQLELFEINFTAEAISECIKICQNATCSAELTYYPDASKTEMGIVGFPTPALAAQHFNIECDFRQINFEDERHVISRDTHGVTTQKQARPQKIYHFATNPIPRYEVEKTILALKFSNVYVYPTGVTGSGIKMALLTKSPTVEEVEGSGNMLFTMEWDMVLGTYDYQKSNC